MKLYKYRGSNKEIINRDIESLVNNYFWAPTAAQLNDPTEAYVDEIITDFLSKLDAIGLNTTDVRKSFDNLIQKRHEVGIYSLSRTCLDELMWAYYSAGHTGFCIEYDKKRLMLEGRSWKVLDVSYQQNPPIIDSNDISTDDNRLSILKKMIGTKSLRWKNEQEIRIITNNPEKNYYAPSAVTGIYFGCRCPEELITDIRKKLAGRKITYYKIECSPSSYSMKEHKIPYDVNIDGKPIEYLAPMPDDAIWEMEDKDKEFYPYLAKAAEIVRRDTSCAKIYSVFFTDNTPDGKPVIRVQFETNVPVHPYASGFNWDFSINEIREID